MGPIKKALRDKFFPALFRREVINANFRKILGHSVKHGGLGILYAQLSAEIAYNTYRAASRELVDSHLGGSVLNYVGHRACIRKSSLAEIRAKMNVDLGELARRKDLAGGQQRNRPHRAMRNGAWLSAVPKCLNGTELYREEFRDNLRPRYGLMPQNNPVTCDSCGKNFLIKHALS